MPWPFPDKIRPIVRSLGYYLGLGQTAQEAQVSYLSERHARPFPEVQQALPEALRAQYFAERIRAADPTTTFSRLWGLAARATWYAGYHRAPTAAEREWAYTRPYDVLGMAFEVVGRGARSGRFRHYTVTINVPWSASLGAVEDYIRDCIASGSCLRGDFGSEPLDGPSSVITLSGGVLLERRAVTTTMPG